MINILRLVYQRWTDKICIRIKYTLYFIYQQYNVLNTTLDKGHMVVLYTTSKGFDVTNILKIGLFKRKIHFFQQYAIKIFINLLMWNKIVYSIKNIITQKFKISNDILNYYMFISISIIIYAIYVLNWTSLTSKLRHQHISGEW